MSTCFGMSYALERSSCQNDLKGESSHTDIQRANGPEIQNMAGRRTKRMDSGIRIIRTRPMLWPALAGGNDDGGARSWPGLLHA